jgi:hypothetical protein
MTSPNSLLASQSELDVVIHLLPLMLASCWNYGTNQNQNTKIHTTSNWLEMAGIKQTMLNANSISNNMEVKLL